MTTGDYFGDDDIYVKNDTGLILSNSYFVLLNLTSFTRIVSRTN